MGLFRLLFCCCGPKRDRRPGKQYNSQVGYNLNHPYNPHKRSRRDQTQPKTAGTTPYTGSSRSPCKPSTVVSTTVTPHVSDSWIGGMSFFSQSTAAPTTYNDQVDNRPLAMRMGYASGCGAYNKSVGTLPSGNKRTAVPQNRWSC